MTGLEPDDQPAEALNTVLYKTYQRRKYNNIDKTEHCTTLTVTQLFYKSIYIAQVCFASCYL